MLRQFRKYGGGARGLMAVVTSAMPLIIIGGLLYAGLFVKATAVVRQVEPPAIERRDRFFGVSALDGEVVWAAGSSGKIVRSQDGGKSWTRQATPTEANLQSIAAWDDRQAVAVGNDGVILVTGDGGESWKKVATPETSNPNKLLRVRIFGDTAWAVGEFNSVLRSDDRGATWTRVLPEKDRAWNDITFVGALGWLVGEFGSVEVTTDGGTTWTPVPRGEGETKQPSLMGVAFRDAQHGVAVGLTGTLLATVDGGATWTAVPQFTREHLLTVTWDENRWLVLGDKGVMAEGDADGAKWTAGRVAPGDVSWRTQVVRRGTRYFLAGSNLAVLENGALTVAGHAAM